MKTFFGEDKILNGLIIGTIAFAVFFGLMEAIRTMLPTLPYWLDAQKSRALIALIPNVLLIRFYFINRKSDRTGRGILIVTFAAMLAIFFML